MDAWLLCIYREVMCLCLTRCGVCTVRVTCSNSARSASASWSGSQHGISPIAFGFAASYIKNSLLNSSHYTKPSMSVLKSDDLF